MKKKMKWNILLSTIFVPAPVVVFASLFVWFSKNQFSPSQANEASISNPVGFLTSHFVYDGWMNTENIVLASVFLLVVLFYYPRALRVIFASVYPALGLGAGAIAELASIMAPASSAFSCASSCSFYGMSGVASALVGATSASFSISFVLMILLNTNSVRSLETDVRRLRVFRNQALLASSFVIFLVLLLAIAGVLNLAVSSPNQTQGPSGDPTPQPILMQSPPPVLLVHSASLILGFFFALFIFLWANRRYGLFARHSKARNGRIREVNPQRQEAEASRKAGAIRAGS